MPVRAHQRRDDDDRDEDGRSHQDGEAGVQRAATSDPRALSLKEKIAQKMKVRQMAN